MPVNPSPDAHVTRIDESPMCRSAFRAHIAIASRNAGTRVGLTFLLGAISVRANATPLAYFLHSAGPAARPAMILGWVFAGVCVAVCVVISVLLSIALWKKRTAVEPSREANADKRALQWVAAGTAISTLILFVLAVYSLVILNRTARPPTSPALTITVTGYDWWWRVDYPDDDTGHAFVTANEIHIPVGKPVRIILESADVIHAFWVPSLAGKTQMIPGLSNQQWLQADAPGVYLGQCTQYCGVQHAHMAFTVVADTQADYADWRRIQAMPVVSDQIENNTASAAPVAAAVAVAMVDAAGNGNRSLATTNEALFESRCGGCHTVRGTNANGTHAPDLTHFASRRFIAAGVLTNNPENVLNWIMHAQELKPGSRMPSTGLSAGEATQLQSYLASLK